MYAHYSVDSIMAEAAEFVLRNDRMLYAPFFETAETFCAAKNILIGGAVGVDLLAGRPLMKDSFLYELHCDNAYQSAKDLSVLLSQTRSPHVPADTVCLVTNIRHKEFTISINSRVMFKIYAADRFRGQSVIPLMSAVTRGYFAENNILCVSAHMQLIEIYRNLYSPAKMQSWRQDMTNEHTLFPTIGQANAQANSQANDEGYVGGWDGDRAFAAMAKESQDVIIGDYALRALGLEKEARRLQIITATCAEDTKAWLERVLAKTSSQGKPGREARVKYIKHPLNITADFQLIKHTFYELRGDSQVFIMETFNSTQYEMIPYINSTAQKIGSPWVLLRFLLIDAWVTNMLQGSAGIPSRIIASAKVIRQKYKDVNILFPKEFVGVYISESFAKKKLIKDTGEVFAPFYPARRHGGATDPAQQRLTTSPVDLFVDLPAKEQIAAKVFKTTVSSRGTDRERVARILGLLEKHRGRGGSVWGVNKAPNDVLRKDPIISAMLPANIDVLVDFGCGSGADIASLARSKDPLVRRAIGVDIVDEREHSGFEFVRINPQDKLPFADGEVHVYVMFHVLHHMVHPINSVADRMADIARTLRPGGLIWVRDHDVTSPERASNVDFEHLAYYIGSWKGPVETLLRTYNQVEPMIYYSADEVTKMMSVAGLELLKINPTRSASHTYGALYRKKI